MTTAAAPAHRSRRPAGHPRGSHQARPSSAGRPRGGSLLPLVIDVGVPLGVYFLAHDALHLSLWLSLTLSSVVPAVRSVTGLVRARQLNLLAVLMLAVNVAGVAVSFVTGDPRLLIVKDSVISSVIGLAILGSVALRRPLMSAALEPFLTRGEPARLAAWDVLSAGSTRFRRKGLEFSTIWGLALLADCVARLIGAFILPVTTMAWLSTVFLVTAIVAASGVGSVASVPMLRMIDDEVRASADDTSGRS